MVELPNMPKLFKNKKNQLKRELMCKGRIIVQYEILIRNWFSALKKICNPGSRNQITVYGSKHHTTPWTHCHANDGSQVVQWCRNTSMGVAILLFFKRNYSPAISWRETDRYSGKYVNWWLVLCNQPVYSNGILDSFLWMETEKSYWWTLRCQLHTCS